MHDIGFQWALLENVVSHSLLHDSLPSYLQIFSSIKHNEYSVQSLKIQRITTHLVGAKKQHLTLAKDVVGTMATSKVGISH